MWVDVECWARTFGRLVQQDISCKAQPRVCVPTGATYGLQRSSALLLLPHSVASHAITCHKPPTQHISGLRAHAHR